MDDVLRGFHTHFTENPDAARPMLRAIKERLEQASGTADDGFKWTMGDESDLAYVRWFSWKHGLAIPTVYEVVVKEWGRSRAPTDGERRRADALIREHCQPVMTHEQVWQEQERRKAARLEAERLAKEMMVEDLKRSKSERRKPHWQTWLERAINGRACNVAAEEVQR